jgi:hypothetical protein
MLIDTKQIKALDFLFCGSCSPWLVAGYAETKKNIQSVNRNITGICDFLVYANNNNFSTLTQELVNQYISKIYSDFPFSYAEVLCSYIRGFCKYLFLHGYCEFVTFTTKPKPAKKSKIRIVDYYTFLSVTPDCTMCEIKKAYHKMAIQFHPDLNQDEKAAEKMVALNKIFNILKDESERLSYDLAMGFKPSDGFDVPTRNKRYYTICI